MSALVAKELQEQNKLLSDFLDERAKLDNKYPIGFLFVSSISTPPNARGIPGTWEAIPEGHTIIGAGSTYLANSTGGSVTHKHNAGNLGAALTMASSSILMSSVQRNELTHTPTAKINASSREEYNTPTDYIVPVLGSTDDASNRSPYIAKYMWVRIA